MKKHIYIVLFTLSSVFYKHIEAQQQSLFSQYMFNDIIFNPAVAGAKNYVPINLSVRRQWMGINEAPVTQFISAHGYMDWNMGIGGYVFNQVTGPIRRTGFSVSGAYHLRLGESSMRHGGDRKALSFGLSLSMQQYFADREKLKTRIANDPTIQAAYNYQLIPDASFGIYYHYANNYYVGLSVNNLIQSRLDLLNTDTIAVNHIVRHYYLMGGYNFDMSGDIILQPTILIQTLEILPFQAEITLRSIYKRNFWIGCSYRHKDAIVGMLGVQNYYFRFGYSYDYTLSDLRSYNVGSHEISLTLFLMNQEFNHQGKTYQGEKIRRQRNKGYKPDIIDF